MGGAERNPRHVQFPASQSVRAASALQPQDDRFDVILLRNVMLYFSPETRAALLSGLHGLIAPDGILLLGSSEQADSSLWTPVVAGGTCYYQPKGVGEAGIGVGIGNRVDTQKIDVDPNLLSILYFLFPVPFSASSFSTSSCRRSVMAASGVRREADRLPHADLDFPGAEPAAAALL